MVDFECLDDQEVPSDTLKDAVISEYEDDTKEYRMNTIWYHFQSMKSIIWNHDGFSLLFQCTLVVLLISLFNASIKRVSTLVNKNK